MKNAADLSSVIHRVDLSQSEKKVPETLRSFVSEKMNPDLQFSNFPCFYLRDQVWADFICTGLLRLAQQSAQPPAIITKAQVDDSGTTKVIIPV